MDSGARVVGSPIHVDDDFQKEVDGKEPTVAPEIEGATEASTWRRDLAVKVALCILVPVSPAVVYFSTSQLAEPKYTSTLKYTFSNILRNDDGDIRLPQWSFLLGSWVGVMSCLTVVFTYMRNPTLHNAPNHLVIRQTLIDLLLASVVIILYFPILDNVVWNWVLLIGIPFASILVFLFYGYWRWATIAGGLLIVAGALVRRWVAPMFHPDRDLSCRFPATITLGACQLLTHACSFT